MKLKCPVCGFTLESQKQEYCLECLKYPEEDPAPMMHPVNKPTVPKCELLVALLLIVITLLVVKYIILT